MNNMCNRTLPIQGLRVILMLGIVLLHTYGHPILGSGQELVSFFFVVSGFLYRDNLPWKKYILKKTMKLFPAYWMVLFIYCLMCLFNGENKLSLHMLPYVLLVQSWIPKTYVYYAFEYVGTAWFLSSLLFCYILSPFCYSLIVNRNKKHTMLLLLFLFLCIVLCKKIDTYFSLGAWLSYICPISRLLEYLMGMCLWSIIKDKRYLALSLYREWIPLTILFLYFWIIGYQLSGWASSILHILMIAMIYLIDSKVINKVLANHFIVMLSSYVLFVFLTHQSLTLKFLRPIVEEQSSSLFPLWIINFMLVILCWIVGVFLGRCYNVLYSIMVKLKSQFKYEKC